MQTLSRQCRYQSLKRVSEGCRIFKQKGSPSAATMKVLPCHSRSTALPARGGTKLFSSAAPSLQDKFPHLLRQAQVMTPYNNEDVASEHLLLDRLTRTSGNKLRCLLVTGGGDNFLSVLAHPSVSQVTLVDTAPLAHAIGRTKLALATSNLSKKEILSFLGSYDAPIDGMDRSSVFESVVKPNLPADTVDLLESKFACELEHGFNRFGALDNSNRHINHILATKHGFSMSDIFHGTVSPQELERLKQVLQDRENPIVTVDTYMETTGLDKQLPPPVMEVFTSSLTEGIFSIVFDGHLSNVGVKSHMARMTYLHSYSDSYHPEWLNDNIREKLRNVPEEALKIVTGDLLELRSFEDKFDLISPSNIFDWMPIDKCASAIQGVCDKHLEEQHGVFLFRRGFGGAPEVATAVGDTLHICPDISSAQLAEADTAPFFYKNAERMACFELK